MHSHGPECQLSAHVLLGSEAHPLPFQILCQVKNWEGAWRWSWLTSTDITNTQTVHHGVHTFQRPAKQSKLVTQSQEGLELNFPVSTYNTKSHGLRIRTGAQWERTKSCFRKIHIFQLAVCKQPVSTACVFRSANPRQSYLLNRIPHCYINALTFCLFIHKFTAC